MYYKKERPSNEKVIFKEEYISRMRQRFGRMIEVASENITPKHDQYMLIGDTRNRVELRVHNSGSVCEISQQDGYVKPIGHLPTALSPLEDRIKFESRLVDIAIENGTLDHTDTSLPNGHGDYDYLNP